MDDALPRCGDGRRPDAAVRLAYGEREDGTVVHIADVASGLACSCVCAGCGAVLVARKGSVNEHHFAHHDASECAHAYESALHKLAKEVLHDRKEILLPAVGAEMESRSLVLHEEHVHGFEDAILEQRTGPIVPDVVVRRGDHRLLVEMFVTHRCGPEKIHRIREMGISCLEVDLRRLPRGATRDEVEQALLKDAPRHWIHNPKLERANRLLASEIEKERLAKAQAADAARARNELRLDRLAAAVAETMRLSLPAGPATPGPVMRRVERHGFKRHTGRAIAGDHWFDAAPVEWQSEVIDRFVVAPLERSASSYYDFNAADVLRHLRSIGFVRQGAFVARQDEAAMLTRIPGFRSQLQIVQAYLQTLASDGVIRDARSRWRVAEDAGRLWSERRRRAEELDRWSDDLRSTVARILGKTEAHETEGFRLEAWWAGVQPSAGISFEAAFETDDRRLTTLAHLLGRIDATLTRNGELDVDRLGLPIEGAIRREGAARVAKQEARDKAQADQQRQEAEGREAAIGHEARQALGRHAAAWLTGEDRTLGVPPATAAAQSHDGLQRARTALRDEASALERAARRERLQARIMALAETTRDPARARLFLTTTHHDWRGGRPIDMCLDDMSFEALRSAMTKIAR